MATLIDEQVEPTEEQPQEQPQEEPAQEEPEKEIPEFYRGKSPKELVELLEDRQRTISRQGNELGELRKVADDAIKMSVAQQAPPEPEDDLDFFTDPEKAIARQIEQHPKVKEAEMATIEMRKNNAMSTLQSKHPDMQQILNDQGFVDWVSASNVRKKLYLSADQQYDHEAADELFTLWKERKEVAQQTAQVEKTARKQQVKQASTGDTRSSGEAPSRKVYRRADIIKLMKEDPTRYEAMSDDILKAYAEGRVQ